MNTPSLFLTLACLCAPFTTAALDDLAPLDDRYGGRMEATVGGQRVVLPALKVDVHADVAGDLATVTVVQSFLNPTSTPLNATYVFPLNEDAAVFEMTMTVGEEIVRAQIKQVDEARLTFEAARRAGKSAALLSEHRPNLFTQEIANLVPELPITVTLRYVQTVLRVDGEYELNVPLVVGPRYIPAGRRQAAPGVVAGTPDESKAAERAAESGATASRADGWQLDAMPAQAPVHGIDVPDSADADRVSVSVRLDAGMPVQRVKSPTHEIDVGEEGDSVRNIRLAAGRTIDNRDFVLRYRLAGAAVNAGILAHEDERGGFFSLLIEPPAVPAVDQITPREMVFVLDCSGSMAGLPIDASKQFVREVLRKLRANDSFRIIRFSDGATEFSEDPLRATPDNVRAGIAYVDSLRGEGGTEMKTGIEQALGIAVPQGAVRIVVFLTDGYIGNEYEIIELLKRRMGEARLFAFGVGTAVNRFLLSQMGRVGRGFTRYMDPTERIATVARELAERLQSPVLTDVEIEWGDLQPQEIHPSRTPDLFAGHSLRVQGRFARGGTHSITVTGKINGRTARLPLTIDLSGMADHGAVPLVWARAAIAEAMDELTFPLQGRANNASDGELQKRVTGLGLDYSLVTRWTSFVAVSNRVVNPKPENNADASIAVPMVDGVAASAYPTSHNAPQAYQQAASAQPPQYAQSSGSRGYSGSGSPEPATTTALLIAAGAGVSALRRRKKVR